MMINGMYEIVANILNVFELALRTQRIRRVYRRYLHHICQQPVIYKEQTGCLRTD